MRYTVTTFKVRLEVAESGIRMRNSETAAIIARGIFNRLDADKEHIVVMGTNNKNQINGYKEVSTGTLTSSLVSPGEVFLAALRLRAAAIICVHILERTVQKVVHLNTPDLGFTSIGISVFSSSAAKASEIETRFFQKLGALTTSCNAPCVT